MRLRGGAGAGRSWPPDVRRLGSSGSPPAPHPSWKQSKGQGWAEGGPRRHARRRGPQTGSAGARQDSRTGHALSRQVV